MAACDDWSSGDEQDPEAEAAEAAMRRGGKKGAANQPLEAKRRGGKKGVANVPLEAKQRGGRNAPLEAKRLGGKRSAATRRANAAAAKVAELMAELMDKLTSWAERLEAERLEAERLEGGGL